MMNNLKWRGKNAIFQIGSVEFLALCQDSARGSSENFSEWKNSPIQECSARRRTRTANPRVKTSCADHYTMRALQWRRRDLNPQSSDYKSAILPLDDAPTFIGMPRSRQGIPFYFSHSTSAKVARSPSTRLNLSGWRLANVGYRFT